MLQSYCRNFGSNALFKAAFIVASSGQLPSHPLHPILPFNYYCEDETPTERTAEVKDGFTAFEGPP